MVHLVSTVPQRCLPKSQTAVEAAAGRPNQSRRSARPRSALLGHRDGRVHRSLVAFFTHCPLSVCFSTASHSTSQLSQRLKTTYKASTSKVLCLQQLSRFSVPLRERGEGWEFLFKCETFISKRIKGAKETRWVTIITTHKHCVNIWRLISLFCHPVPVQSPRQNRWSSHLQCGHTVVGRRFMGNFLNALCVTKHCGWLLQARSGVFVLFFNI